MRPGAGVCYVGTGWGYLLVKGSLNAGWFGVAGGREYLTGFHKRKVERRKAALDEIKRKLKEEQRKLKEEVPLKTPHPTPPSAVRGCGVPASHHGGQAAGKRVLGWRLQRQGCRNDLFQSPSEAPGVLEDAEREGGGAR